MAPPDEQERGQGSSFVHIEPEVGHANPRIVLVRLLEERLQCPAAELRPGMEERQPASLVVLRRIVDNA